MVTETVTVELTGKMDNIWAMLEAYEEVIDWQVRDNCVKEVDEDKSDCDCEHCIERNKGA